MRSFQLYIDDIREAEPRVLVLSVRDEARAREIAGRVLDEDEHHRGVELCERGQRVLGLGSFERRSWCDQPRAPARWRGASLPAAIGSLARRAALATAGRKPSFSLGQLRRLQTTGR